MWTDPFLRQFQVRFDECDVYGHVNNAHYVRFLLETARAAALEQEDRLLSALALPAAWQPRHVDVEYLHPLRYGDTVTVTTHIIDLTPTAIRRTFHLRTNEAGRDVATGLLEANPIDPPTGETLTLPATPLDPIPSPQPPTPDPQLLPATPRDPTPNPWPPTPETHPLPDPPPPPPGTFRMRRQVAWEELDRRGCVNEGAYLDYVGECGIRVVAAHGWPVARMSAAGFAIIMRRHQVEYVAPAFLGDELEIATWAAHVRRSTAMRYYTITRTSDQQLLARVHTYAVWLDLATGRPIRIPPHFMDAFASNLG